MHTLILSVLAPSSKAQSSISNDKVPADVLVLVFTRVRRPSRLTLVQNKSRRCTRCRNRWAIKESKEDDTGVTHNVMASIWCDTRSKKEMRLLSLSVERLIWRYMSLSWRIPAIDVRMSSMSGEDKGVYSLHTIPTDKWMEVDEVLETLMQILHI